MRILLDENIPAALGHALIAAGFEVRGVAEFALSAPDIVVLAESEREAEVLVTADKDFGELVYHRALGFHGVVLVRAHPVADHISRIVRAMAEHRDALADAFMVISPNRVRMRSRRGGTP